MDGVELTNDVARGIATEPGSSQYSLDAHNRNLVAIESLSEFGGLRSLDLSFNRLERVEGLSALTDLRELRLYHNKLADLDALLHNPKLESLVANDNLLDEIAIVFKKLRHLKSLNLARNRLTQVKNLGACRFLGHLDLSGNQIANGRGLEALVHLEFLDVSDNKLPCLPEMPGLHKLSELRLSGNRFTTANSVAQFANLEVLRLDRNRIGTLDRFPSTLRKLEELYLSDNRISRVRPLLQAVPALDVLDLSGNALDDDEDLNALAEFEQLRELRLRGNPVATGDNDWWYTLARRFPNVEALEDVVITERDRAVDLAGDRSHMEGGRPGSSWGGRRPSLETPRRRSSFREGVPAEVAAAAAAAGAASAAAGGSSGSAPVVKPNTSRVGAMQQMYSQEEVVARAESLRNKFRDFRELLSTNQALLELDLEAQAAPLPPAPVMAQEPQSAVAALEEQPGPPGPTPQAPQGDAEAAADSPKRRLSARSTRSIGPEQPDPLEASQAAAKQAVKAASALFADKLPPRRASRASSAAALLAPDVPHRRPDSARSAAAAEDHLQMSSLSLMSARSTESEPGVTMGSRFGPAPEPGSATPGTAARRSAAAAAQTAAAAQQAGRDAEYQAATYRGPGSPTEDEENEEPPAPRYKPQKRAERRAAPPKRGQGAPRMGFRVPAEAKAKLESASLNLAPLQ